MKDEKRKMKGASSGKRVGIYETGKTLGEGTFGKVKQATNTNTGAVVAIKILDKEKIQSENMGKQVKREITVMKRIQHPHVIQLHEVLASKKKIFIVLELVTGGELFDKIEVEGRYEEDAARFYFQQLVVGVEYCHRQGICHRDLKPQNLLLDSEGNLKISDFGLSSMTLKANGEDTLMHTTCGTPMYCAPEVIAGKGYDGIKSDTWSVGVILFVIAAGHLPFDAPTLNLLFIEIRNARVEYPACFSIELIDLLSKLLVVDVTKRWSLQQVMGHKWWKKSGPYKDELEKRLVEVEPEPLCSM